MRSTIHCNSNNSLLPTTFWQLVWIQLLHLETHRSATSYQINRTNHHCQSYPVHRIRLSHWFLHRFNWTKTTHRVKFRRLFCVLLSVISTYMDNFDNFIDIFTFCSDCNRSSVVFVSSSIKSNGCRHDI